jgi:hypothetical protein
MELLKRLDAVSAEDEDIQAIKAALEEGLQRCPQVPYISLSECALEQNRVYFRQRLLVPDNEDLRTDIIRMNHDPPAIGHPGRDVTYRLIARQFYWHGMTRTISQYLRNCLICLRSKPSHHSPQGLLKPMSVPQERWKDISVDFIVGLPLCEGRNAIATIVDRFTKRRHFIPCHDSIDGRAFAQLYIDQVYRLHGLSDNIVTDRGPQFNSDFWRQVCKALGLKPRMSTAYHPQTDGQSEIANAGVEQYLRIYCCYHQNDWLQYLSLAEFAINNSVSASTTLTPF